MLPAARCPAIVLPGDRLLLGARSDERGPGLWERKTYPHKVWNIRNVRQRLLPSSCTADQLSAPFLRKGHLIPRWWRSDGEGRNAGAPSEHGRPLTGKPRWASAPGWRRDAEPLQTASPPACSTGRFKGDGEGESFANRMLRVHI